MSIRFTNNAVATLAAGVSTSSTAISLTPGAGALFPILLPGDWFPVTVLDSTGALEVMRCTARSGDVLTVERAQEGTQARAFNAGARVEHRMTAGAIEFALEDVLLRSALPPGFGPVPWSLPFEPAGWIFADGRALMVGTPYQALRTAYIDAGCPWGQDGSGNPYVPNMRGRVAAGVDGSGVLDDASFGALLGSKNHVLTVDQMPPHGHAASSSSAGAHTHSVSGTAASAGAHTHSLSNAWANSGGSAENINYFGQGAVRIITATGSAGAHTHSVSGTAASAGAHAHTITVSNNGGGQAHSNVQPTLVTNMIVKT